MKRPSAVRFLIVAVALLALAAIPAISGEEIEGRWDPGGVFRVTTQFGHWLCTNIPLDNQLDVYYNFCELVSTAPRTTTNWHGELHRTGPNSFYMNQMAYTLDGAWLFVTAGRWWRGDDGLIYSEFYWATYGSWQDPYTDLPLDCQGPINGDPGTGFALDIIPECTPD